MPPDIVRDSRLGRPWERGYSADAIQPCGPMYSAKGILSVQLVTGCGPISPSSVSEPPQYPSESWHSPSQSSEGISENFSLRALGPKIQVFPILPVRLCFVPYRRCRAHSPQSVVIVVISELSSLGLQPPSSTNSHTKFQRGRFDFL